MSTEVKKNLTPEDNDYITMRAAAYITATIEAYNKEALNVVDRTPENAMKEGTAAITALTSITLSVISSIAENKEALCVILSRYIDDLDKALLDLEEMKEDAYLATPEVDDSLLNEAEAEWLARQRINEHDVTCCDEDCVATQP